MSTTLDHVTARWNLLEHSFYRRWTTGTLTRAELCDYVGQYAHVVRAVPGWLEQVRGADHDELARHAAEERSHVALWERFGESLGLSGDAVRSTPANPATAELLEQGDRFASEGLAAAVVWALEVQTPAVAEAKLAGLELHYGIDAAAGGKYFAVHQHLDVEHAAQLQALCTGESETAAASMSEALWGLLSSVENHSRDLMPSSSR